MKFDISKTNGEEYALEIGNTRFKTYINLKDLLTDLKKVIDLQEGEKQ